MTQKVITGGVEGPKLRSFIERIERLEEEKSGLASDITDVFQEAKSNGFDVKAIRAVLKLRKLKANERTEAEYMLELYKRALGMDSTLEEPEDAGDQVNAPEDDPEDDELYKKAKTIVLEHKKASTSFVQRKLTIGYNRAARLIERMEGDGIVGPANHVGKREVIAGGACA